MAIAIADDPSLANAYTGRGNLVAVVSNGTAVLGLGNIGPLAGKPVMEGKSVLFKAFADVNAYDINLALTDPDKIIEVVKALEPTFGGINLEDIKAPECFYIEEVLKKEMNIPVFHDDQHGTAIISGAGLINALEITGKKAEDFIVVVSGAGAAAIACAKFYTELGIDPANIRMFDSKGILHKGRIVGDGEAGVGDAGGIGHRQVFLGEAGFDGKDFKLSRAGFLMVGEGLFLGEQRHDDLLWFGFK